MLAHSHQSIEEHLSYAMMARQVWEETKEKVAVALHAQQSEGAWSVRSGHWALPRLNPVGLLQKKLCWNQKMTEIG